MVKIVASKSPYVPVKGRCLGFYDLSSIKSRENLDGAKNVRTKPYCNFRA